MPDNWSPEEVAATVASYCAMLELELRGQSFNKAQYNRVLRHLLNNRSEGAVEFKHANVSAAMIELGFPYIDGYKPRGNYQASLRAEITEQWDARPILATLALQAVAALAPDRQDTLVTADIFVPAPKRTQERSALYERPSTPFTPRISVNYLNASRREVAVSAERAEQYSLYRLYKFRSSPKVYVLDGSLQQSCLLDPIQYSARPA